MKFLQIKSADQAGQLSVISNNIFVYQPGGVAQKNVYTDWEALVSALEDNFGTKLLQFDDTFEPIVIPIGTWNMEDVTWSNDLSHPIVVTVDEGTEFIKLRRIQNSLTVTFTGTTPPITDFDNGQNLLIVELDAHLTCSGTGPFIRCSNPLATVVMFFENSGGLVTGSVPIIDIAVAGANCIFSTSSFANIMADVLSGDAGSFWIAVIGASSANIDRNQPNFLGGTFFGILTAARMNITESVLTGPGVFAAESNQLMRCDSTGGVIQINLPDAFNNKGKQIVVKNVGSSTNNIDVTPTGSDTIDGAAVASIVTAQGSLTVISDGISNWMIV